MSSGPSVRDILRSFFHDHAVVFDNLEVGLMEDSIELLASTLEAAIKNEDHHPYDLFLAPRIRDLNRMTKRIKDPRDAKRAIEAANTLVALIVKAQDVPV